MILHCGKLPVKENNSIKEKQWALGICLSLLPQLVSPSFSASCRLGYAMLLSSSGWFYRILLEGDDGSRWWGSQGDYMIDRSGAWGWPVDKSTSSTSMGSQISIIIAIVTQKHDTSIEWRRDKTLAGVCWKTDWLQIQRDPIARESIRELQSRTLNVLLQPPYMWTQGCIFIHMWEIYHI